MTNNLEIKGLTELIQAMADSPEIARPLMEQAMTKSLLGLRDVLRDYPPQPPRDRAKTFNTYVRGRGRYPRSAFPGGQLNSRAGTTALHAGQVRLTSERLGSKWTHATEWGSDYLEGVLGNTASYALEVQGSAEDQNYWHGVTGWPTIDGTLNDQEEQIYQNYDEALTELIAQLEKRR